MIRRGTVTDYDSGTHTATVFLDESLDTTIAVKVADNIETTEVTAGQRCAVLFGEDTTDVAGAAVIAVWTA